MALPQGINFRNSTAYVTDGTNESAEIYNAAANGTAYPRTTAEGNTVGWENVLGSSLFTRNRNSGNDRRLAGIGFPGGGSSGATYRIDLPSAGSYTVRIAAGDASYSCVVGWDLKDTSTLLASLTTGSTSASQRFKDATNVERTNATWPGSNASATYSFSTTILRLVSTGTDARIAHFYVESSGGGASFIAAKPYVISQGVASGVY